MNPPHIIAIVEVKPKNQRFLPTVAELNLKKKTITFTILTQKQARARGLSFIQMRIRT